MPGAYQAARAHEQAKHLAARPKGLKIEDPQLRSFVVAKLNEHWPPCQIAAAWMHEPDNGDSSELSVGDRVLVGGCG